MLEVNLHQKKSFSGNGQKAEFNGHLVDLRQVVKTYQSSAGTFTALKGIDLQVETGAFVSIIGKSGSGKSTLINVITGIDRPTSGEVVVDHVQIHTLNEEQIAIWRGRSIGVIFQFFQLLPTLTAVENILLAMDYGGQIPKGQRPERALYLLELVGMADQAHRLPNSLSGGQQQCVAIARALANDPVLLTADEPTGNLDSKSAEMVFHLFETLAQSGKTILMVTHDNDLASRAQRTIRLADGRIVDEFVNR
jgi:putative ABC transport system ATP-binding protein